MSYRAINGSFSICFENNYCIINAEATTKKDVVLSYAQTLSVCQAIVGKEDKKIYEHRVEDIIKQTDFYTKNRYWKKYGRLYIWQKSKPKKEIDKMLAATLRASMVRLGKASKRSCLGVVG